MRYLPSRLFGAEAKKKEKVRRLLAVPIFVLELSIMRVEKVLQGLLFGAQFGKEQ